MIYPYPYWPSRVGSMKSDYREGLKHVVALPIFLAKLQESNNAFTDLGNLPWKLHYPSHRWWVFMRRIFVCTNLYRMLQLKLAIAILNDILCLLIRDIMVLRTTSVHRSLIIDDAFPKTPAILGVAMLPSFLSRYVAVCPLCMFVM